MSDQSPMGTEGTPEEIKNEITVKPEIIPLPNKNPGRGRLWEDPELMQQSIDSYFETRKPSVMLDIDGNQIVDAKGFPKMKVNPPSLTGLCLWLGYSSKGAILDGIKKNDGFSNVLQAARLRCENYVEESGMTGDTSPQFATFLLKNYDWKDKHEVEMTAPVPDDDAAKSVLAKHGIK